MPRTPSRRRYRRSRDNYPKTVHLQFRHPQFNEEPPPDGSGKFFRQTRVNQSSSGLLRLC
eukprot:7426230-Pyramimonas_sp.AAC.1